MTNGRPRGKFKCSKGLQEGDPISPFLFTLVGDGVFLKGSRLEGIVLKFLIYNLLMTRSFVMWTGVT